MSGRFALTSLMLFAFWNGHALAQELFAPILPPSKSAQLESQPVEPIKPPRILEEEPVPLAGNALEESYQDVNPAFPNKFGSAPNQRTWGFVSGRFIPDGEKMAPNGSQYNPYFSLDLLFNVALTPDRRLYGFLDTRFWAQGNKNDGGQYSVNISKRQIDLTLGAAWNFYDRFEARLYAYTNNSLNRGENLADPFGFNDGAALEGRYYFGGTDFDTGIYNFLSIGYYFSKDMVGNDGNKWEPSAYLRWNYNIPIWEQRAYIYTIGEFITEQPFEAKWVWLDTGISFRPIERYPQFDLRLGNESNIDIVNSKSFTMWYLAARLAY